MSERIIDVVTQDVVVSMDYSLIVEGQLMRFQRKLWAIGIYSRP